MGEYADSLKKKSSTKTSESVEAAREAAAKQAAADKARAATAAAKAKATEAKDSAEALKLAQKTPVRDAHDKPIASQQPLPYTPPPTTGIPKSGGPLGKGSQADLGDSVNEAMPPTPTPDSSSNISEPVRIAQRNVFDISSLVPELSPEHIAKILFENVSAIELSISERHDTIEGINQKYSIISNLSEIRKKYDAEKQLSPMDKFKPLTSIYTINIEDKIPQEDYIELEALDSTYQYLDENNQLVTRKKGYYYIDTNGDLVIELINLEKNQEVEVYIDTNGTIYKIDKVEL